MRGAVVGSTKWERRKMKSLRVPGTLLFCVSVVVSLVSTVLAATDPSDVSALNSMFTGLGNDARLTKWVQSAGDPCGEQWLGVTCEGSSVTAIKLSGVGLQGTMEGWVLQKFGKLSVLDLSHNNFNVDIPNMFPPQLTDLDLSFNKFSGAFPYLLINIPTLKSVKLSNNVLKGPLNDQVFSKLVNLVTLDLSNNEFTGAIPATVGDMTSLQNLYLQNNQLTGPLPKTLSNLVSLQVFDVSNNQLTGYLPSNFSPRTFNYQGNQIIQQAPPPPPFTSPPPPPPSNPRSPPPAAKPASSSSSFSGATIAGIAVAIVLVLAVAALSLWFFRIRKRPERAKAFDLEANNNHNSNNNNSRRSWFLPLSTSGKDKPTKVKVFEPDTKDKGMDSPKIKAQPPVKTLKVPPAYQEPRFKKAMGEVNKNNISATPFSVADLQAATNSFSEENLLGEGTLGRVYRAEFPNGQVLAVKKLDSKASMVQDENKFLSVVEAVAKLHHANTAQLVGYCVEHHQRLLLFPFLTRGTLHDLLHASPHDLLHHHNTNNTNLSKASLSWNMRVKIALGAARALEYLHEICSPPVVHRNFKSANILLDDELNPHVSDCGLEALAPSGSERQMSAQILGTAGYGAPEYAMAGTYTVKSDVYSFGCVMLELLTGRKPLDSSRPRSEQNLVRWATPQLHDIDALARMVDPALEGVYPAKSLSRLADIVALCVQPEPEFRPPMSEVVQSLVRLMQRATLSKRRTDSESAASQADIPEPYEYSN